jgi:hypothetical protein
MWRGKAIGVVLVVGLGGLGVSACGGDEGCNPQTVERASAFVDAHQSCETDADCVVVRDHCGVLPGGFCGQLSLSREGAASAEWRSLDAELQGCSPSSCAVCAAAMIPTCTSGSCRRPME